MASLLGRAFPESPFFGHSPRGCPSSPGLGPQPTCVDGQQEGGTDAGDGVRWFGFG